MEPAQNQPLFQLNLDAQNGYTLRSAASWAKVLGVISIIMGILFIVMGIMVQSALSGATGNRYEFGQNQRLMANAGMIVYIVLGLICIISALFCLGFGNKIGQAMKTNDQNALNSGFAGARNYFAFWTILMIIMLLFVLIGAAGLISGGGR